MSRREYENMFRGAHEVAAVFAWGFSILILVAYRPPFWPVMILASALLGIIRFQKIKEIWQFRASISLNRMRTISLDMMLQRLQRLTKMRQILPIGRGFKWSQRHAELAVEMLNRNPDELPDIPQFIKTELMRLDGVSEHERTMLDKAIAMAIKGIMPPNTKPILDSDIGSPWIHGIGLSAEEEIGIPFPALPGHTLITGTTRAGKTRLYESLTAQIVKMGKALIVIDPKKDIDWVSMLHTMCKKEGRKFLYFDPAQPHKSIRIQPLKNWNNISEPATRIGQLVDADGSFAAFAWKTLYRIHRALIAAGERPDIRNTKRYVQMGVEGLAEKVIAIHFNRKHGPEWDKDFKALPSAGKNALTRLEWSIMKYADEGDTDDTIDGIISMVRHSKEHYSKMVQVLEPILEMLGSDEIGDLLSPDPMVTSDTRDSWDMRRVIDEGAVLYIALDSLSNKIIASAIGSILLADLASTLGAIYNFSKPADAYLFVDEVAEVANEQLIQILNKGGGAGIKCFLAMQAIADLVVRLGSKEKAEQVLANLNNLISLRVRSIETAKYVSDMFGQVMVRSMDVSYSSGSESSQAFTEFRSNTSRSLKSTASALIPPELLTRLPPLHYFAFVAGRGTYKGIVEYIEADRIAP
ncbi:conjugative transfer system coupling protein TraD [Hydrogenophaga sp. NFH-34]|uniref:conjugative transfer system coupling protein TraD n=1 Tax=Hydrogenophaga sp. NFH-34 TaxID=2744446 RepID=UPI001EEC2A3E|nr:conjugative transfer system coupling protein TraD [Hydrogenophaga sp. NFH-34]